MLGFLAGVAVCAVLLFVANRLGYIAIGKGARADKIDDDLKAVRDRVKG